MREHGLKPYSKGRLQKYFNKERIYKKSMIDPNNPDQIASVVKELINILPEETRNSLLNSFAKSVGTGASSIAELVFFPANYLNIQAQGKLQILRDKTQKKIEIKKREGLYSEKNIGMAVKAIEESRYQLDSHVLQDFFSELIANSLDKTKESQITPYFSTILSNLSPKDALFLKKSKEHFTRLNAFKSQTNSLEILRIPCAQYLIATPEGSVPYSDIFVIWDILEYEEIGTILAALSSFGLIEVSFDSHLLSPEYTEQYETISSTAQYKYAESVVKDANDEFNLSVNRGFIHFTDLGKLFFRLVVV